jgi:glutaredoxin
MAIKFHRCSNVWLKIDPHPCWKVQKALDEEGVEYELVKHPAFPRGRRTEVERLTGQRMLPFVEFEDGRVLREESKALAERIRTGRLVESAGGPEGAGAATPPAAEA